MRKQKILLLLTWLLAPFFAPAQHFWLQADPPIAAKKTAVRLTLLQGDKLEAGTGGDLPEIQHFNLYQAKDSFSLKDQALGATALVNPEVVKETFLAAATLQLPNKTLTQIALQHQYTKEQKAMLAIKDTANNAANFPAKQLRFAKTLVPVERHKDKAQIHKKQLNHDLEILLNTNPAEVKAGGQVVLQILLHQRVLPNHKFTVWRQEKNGKVTSAETSTNKYGLRILTIPKPGTYVIVVTQEGPHKSGFSDDIEWKSLEATYSFVVE